MFEQQLRKVQKDQGFIGALDQSGGSTPKVLRQYGVSEDTYSGNEEMFAKIHEMRTRIMTNPHFNGDRILGAILFEDTIIRTIDSKGVAEYLWEDKKIVPFLKVDKGLADEENGVQLMKPIPDLNSLLTRAKDHNVFGTKMRSVIKTADALGIQAIVDQQFEIGLHIAAAGLIPIIEPEVDIHCPQKAEAEALLKTGLLSHLNGLNANQQVMLKLTLPEEDGFYAECIKHPHVLRVVALSGGYSLNEAAERLTRNTGMIASFSRALAEGLTVQQTEDEFSTTLNNSIERIFQASKT
ncbi:MAG: fructose-bisphosphate aldolase class 1 [Nitrospirales bacterium]|nr:MAG: fructose-bisphosphate aldolase class 1 [Nitrospirales bacterium]